jgi:O-antigen ligase
MTIAYWLALGLLLLAWLQPLHVPPWVSWHNELLAAAALLFLCAAALFQSRKPTTGRVWMPTSTLPLFLIMAVALAQRATGVIAYWGSFWVVAFYGTAAAMAAALGYAAMGVGGDGHQPQGSPSDRNSVVLSAVAKAVLTAGLIQLFIVYSQAFGLWEGSDWIARSAYQTRGTGNLAQPNQAALLFLMAIASASYLWRSAPVHSMAPAAVALLATGLATTGSRSGLVGFCALAVWWAYAGHRHSRRTRGVTAIAAIFVLTAMYAAWPHVATAYWLAPAEGVSLTTSGRLGIWSQLLDAVSRHPWRGWGVLQVAEAQSAVAGNYAFVMASTYSHNFWLDVALWAGLPAAALLLVMSCVWIARRMRRSYPPDAWYCIALALPVALQSMTEFPYAYTYFLLPFFFALGALDASLGIRRGFAVGRRAAIAVLVLLTAGGAWAVAEYTKIEDGFRVVRFEALRVGKVPEGYENPPVFVLTQLGALLDGTRIQPAPSMAAKDIETLRNVAMLYPWAPAKFRYLVALALNGQRDEARRQLRVIRVMHGEAAYTGALERLAEMSATFPALKGLSAP